MSTTARPAVTKPTVTTLIQKESSKRSAWGPGGSSSSKRVKLTDVAAKPYLSVSINGKAIDTKKPGYHDFSGGSIDRKKIRWLKGWEKRVKIADEASAVFNLMRQKGLTSVVGCSIKFRVSYVLS